jgi:hypothetical protein
MHDTKKTKKNWNEKQYYIDLIIKTHACSKNMVIVNIYPLLGEFENMTSLIVVFWIKFEVDCITDLEVV